MYKRVHLVVNHVHDPYYPEQWFLTPSEFLSVTSGVLKGHLVYIVHVHNSVQNEAFDKVVKLNI